MAFLLCQLVALVAFHFRNDMINGITYFYPFPSSSCNLCMHQLALLLSPDLSRRLGLDKISHWKHGGTG
jgi:hypothetical protein